MSDEYHSAITMRVEKGDVAGVVAEDTWCAFIRRLVLPVPVMMINPSVYGQLELQEIARRAKYEYITNKR